jgi:hypothetical protein
LDGNNFYKENENLSRKVVKVEIDGKSYEAVIK